MARQTNIFKNLRIIEDEDSNDVNMDRKATKKLREIESLKNKDKKDLTDSEKEKISKEQYWKNILDPVKESIKESIKDTKKRLKKEKERDKIKQRRRREKEIILEEDCKKREEEERKRQKEREERYEEYKRREEEERERREEEEYTRQQEEHIKQKEYYPIELEYKQILKEFCGNLGKTFRKCSLKYHPDRNIGNEELANENQKKLLEIHEKFSRKRPFE